MLTAPGGLVMLTAPGGLVMLTAPGGLVMLTAPGGLVMLTAPGGLVMLTAPGGLVMLTRARPLSEGHPAGCRGCLCRQQPGRPYIRHSCPGVWLARWWALTYIWVALPLTCYANPDSCR
jgi:hypothetical protein